MTQLPLLYKCEKCNKSFDEKSKYKRHLKKKFPCIDIILSSQTPETLDKCKYCAKMFKSFELQKHLNDCDCICYYKQHMELVNLKLTSQALSSTIDNKGVINVNVICTNRDDLENNTLIKELNTQKTKKRKKYSNRVRNIIGARQKWCCANCSEMFGPVWHVDHVIPLVSKEDNIENENNLQGLCVNCHALKTNQEGIKYNF